MIWYQIPNTTPPGFSGFWNDGSKSKNHFEVIDGSNSRVDEIETTLYPVGTGLKGILPAKLKIAVMDFSLPSGMNDFFSFFADVCGGKTKVLETESLEINFISLVASTSGNSKKFKTIFIPLVSGEKEIPAASLSFFSLLKKQYENHKDIVAKNHHKRDPYIPKKMLNINQK